LATFVERYKLHREFLSKASSAGYHVIGIIGADYPRSAFSNVEIDAVPQCGKSIGDAYRQGLRLALEEREFAAYSEPEKVSYVREIHKTLRPLLAETADLVVPKRTLSGFKTYPAVQRHTEALSNAFFARLSGQEVDAYFGPESLNRDAAAPFLSYEQVNFPGKEDSHDAHIVPIMECIISKLKVISIPVNYVHPAVQRKLEATVEASLKRYSRLYAHSRCLLKRYWQLGAKRELVCGS
jgi:hypothetical protein